MRAEFFRAESPDEIVGLARWTSRGLELEAPSDEDRSSLESIFRRTPVAIADASLRAAGTSGPVVLNPGTLEWFRAAARERSGAVGLAVRLVQEEQGSVGWDPAGSYRTFSESVRRKVLMGEGDGGEPLQPGETRPEGARGPSESGTEAAQPAPRPSAAGPSDSPARG